MKDKKRIIKSMIRFGSLLWVCLAVMLLSSGYLENHGSKGTDTWQGFRFPVIKPLGEGGVLGTRSGRFLNFAARFTDDPEKLQDKEYPSDRPDEEDSVRNADADTDADFLKDSSKEATVMIYMIGSDLETRKSEATQDIAEMIASGIGENVNVIIQTMGTRKWNDYDIASDHTQIHSIRNGKLTLEKDDMAQLDSTRSDTLSDFIEYCAVNYTAERYMLFFWDHGAGPVYGFGYDEWQSEDDSLTLDEIVKALDDNKDVHFDIIGMDSCVMANLETVCAMSPYCDYTVLSEDFESSLGWQYTEWMKELEKNPQATSGRLGRLIIDSTISTNETSEDGKRTTMVMVNESRTDELFEAWKNYAYSNEEDLLSANYSRLYKASGRSSGQGSIWKKNRNGVTIEDYYITDIGAVVHNVNDKGDEAEELTRTLRKAIFYLGRTRTNNGLNGLSVSLPYGDEEFYEKLCRVYSRCGFDNEYIEWLRKFVTADGSENYYDYEDDGWTFIIYGDEDNGPGSDPASPAFGLDMEYIGDEDSGEAVNKPDISYEYIVGDWKYDESEDVWYLKDGSLMYLYDEESGTMYYYDDSDNTIYYYDEYTGNWQLTE